MKDEKKADGLLLPDNTEILTQLTRINNYL